MRMDLGLLRNSCLFKHLLGLVVGPLLSKGGSCRPGRSLALVEHLAHLHSSPTLVGAHPGTVSDSQILATDTGPV